MLTAGVDVQDDRLEVEVVGWGKGEESWAIDYHVLWGDPGSEELWQRLDEALASRYQHELGGRLNITATCVDSGGHFTQQVYGYCRKHRHQRIYAIKGMAGSGRPIVTAPSRRGSGHRRRTVDLFTVGVDAAKGLLYSRLGLTVPGAGYCHFPTSPAFDEEYFAQLTAEKIITRYHKGFPRREWVKTRPRNEALDCRVYAMAAMYILSPAWDAIEQRLTRKPKEKPAQNTWSRRPVRRRGNRALDWKERF